VNRKKVVIIGGGFGGLKSAKALKNANLDVLLIDRTNHHLFQPLLYQVATAALSPSDIANPIRDILRDQKNIEVIMKTVEAIDTQNRMISTTEKDSYSYDYLVVAPGARHHYFGKNDWEVKAPGLKTLSDAVNIRNIILSAFEKAESCEDKIQQSIYLRFLIIGGGPTGVELAGSLAEMAKHSMRNNFRRINPENSEIVLIEGLNHLLPSYPEHLSLKAQKDLEQLGVKVLTNTKVTDISEQGIYLGKQYLPAATILWAAGNQASPLLKTLNIPLDRQGRVLVEPDLSIPGHPEVFVIGDAASLQDTPLPGIAPVAMQQGKYVANLIKEGTEPAKRKPFVYHDKGMMATIGRGKAIAVIGSVKISGFLAWLSWGLIHIYYLIGFQNRLIVLLNWFYLYLTHNRNARLITREKQ
jgi:NADH:ubiquinone reductase (H+-translocating)